MIGTIDGVNTLFNTGIPYTPNTFAGFTNGQLTKAANDDGWIETDPSTGDVTWKEAPKPGDVLQGFLLDTSAALPEVVITKLSGTVRPVNDLSGSISGTDFISASVSGVDELSALLSGQDSIDGTVSPVVSISGRIQVVCQ